ncbi:MAG: hypothetical protein K2X63_09025 [Burkholderiaceae bacterium]|nr:hypothetical protein [Burkholderiaceae bacterium]
MILQHLTSLDTLVLHDDLLWTDEHSWSPVVGSAEYSIKGALIIENGLRLAGRPISLQAPDDSMAWHPRSVIDQLYVWSAQAGQEFQLSMQDGREFNVVFRHHEPPALEAKPVNGLSSTDPDSEWSVKLKFTSI